MTIKIDPAIYLDVVTELSERLDMKRFNVMATLDKTLSSIQEAEVKELDKYSYVCLSSSAHMWEAECARIIGMGIETTIPTQGGGGYAIMHSDNEELLNLWDEKTKDALALSNVVIDVNQNMATTHFIVIDEG